MKQSDLERAFLYYWRILGDDSLAPDCEYRFSEVRCFRFDFAWPLQKVAVEMEGGIWTQGRHVRGRGFIRDCEKYNLAASLGWKVFRLTREMLEEDPVKMIAMIVKGIEIATLPR